MLSYEDYFNEQLRQEKFAILVSARVNDIRAGKASPLDFPKAGGVFNAPIEETLMFADTIARAVCANLERGENK